MLNLKIIVGSTRPGRAADRVVPWITARAERHPAFDVEVLDLRDWPLPFFAENYQTLGDPATRPTPTQSSSGGTSGSPTATYSRS